MSIREAEHDTRAPTGIGGGYHSQHTAGERHAILGQGAQKRDSECQDEAQDVDNTNEQGHGAEKVYIYNQSQKNAHASTVGL